MIKMTKGTYGLKVNGAVEAMTKHSPPFSLPDAREAELVAAGVAVKVAEPEPVQASAYAGMKMAELRKAAAALGVDVSAAKSKKEAIAILETAETEKHPRLYHEENQCCGLLAQE